MDYLNSLKGRSGIYEIKNIITGDVYIGSSKDMAARWRRHKRDLRAGKHHSRYLNRAWAKYGEDAFKFTVLDFVSIERLHSEEMWYFLYNFPTYNMSFETDRPLNTSATPETKAKISAAIRRLGIKPPESTWKPRQKSVSAYDKLSGELVATFDSLASACRWAGRDHTYVSTISKCCNGINKTAWGYKWKWGKTSI